MMAIVRKELKEYLLKPGSISWGVIFPLVFTFSFIIRLGTVDQVAPGMIAIASLFATTSFVSSSLIFERRLRTIERLLLAPISYGEIVIGKILVGTVFGLMVSGLTLLVVLKFMSYPLWSWTITTLALLVSSFMFSAMGVFIALWVRDPINVMTWLNLLRLPMIFTSGALISFALFPKWFLFVGLATPMTYAVEAVRYGVLYYTDVIPPATAFLATLALGLLFTLLGTRALKNMY